MDFARPDRQGRVWDVICRTIRCGQVVAGLQEGRDRPGRDKGHALAVHGQGHGFQFLPQALCHAQGCGGKAVRHGDAALFNMRKPGPDGPDDGHVLIGDRVRPDIRLPCFRSRRNADQDFVFNRHALFVIALVIVFEHVPCGWVIKGDDHFMLAGMEGGQAEIGRPRDNPVAIGAGKQIKLFMAWPAGQ